MNLSFISWIPYGLAFIDQIPYGLAFINWTLQVLALIGRNPHGLALAESKWGLKIHPATSSSWALDIVSIISMTERRQWSE